MQHVSATNAPLPPPATSRAAPSISTKASAAASHEEEKIIWFAIPGMAGLFLGCVVTIIATIGLLLPKHPGDSRFKIWTVLGIVIGAAFLSEHYKASLPRVIRKVLLNLFRICLAVALVLFGLKSFMRIMMYVDPPENYTQAAHIRSVNEGPNKQGSAESEGFHQENEGLHQRVSPADAPTPAPTAVAGPFIAYPGLSGAATPAPTAVAAAQVSSLAPSATESYVLQEGFLKTDDNRFISRIGDAEYLEAKAPFKTTCMPTEITEADRLNGFSWKGIVYCAPTAFRRYNQGFGDSGRSWRQWEAPEQDSLEWSFIVKCRNGTWDISKYESMDSYWLAGKHLWLKKPNAAEVPK